jgi:DNA-binding protein Fis
MDRISAVLISEALQMSGGNRSRASKLLGLSRPTLHAKIEKHHLQFETTVSKKSSPLP